MMPNLRLTSLALNVVQLIIIVVLLWALLKQCNCNDCAPERVIIKVDTIRPTDTKPKPVITDPPTVIKTCPKPHSRPKEVTSYPKKVDVPVINKDYYNFVDECPPSPCDSVRIEGDTVYRPDDYHLIITDTLIDNTNAGRKIEFVNLKPAIRETVTIYQKEKVKVYLGITGGYSFKNKDWDIGPQGAIAIPKIGAATYQYNIRHNEHTIGFMGLLRFQKNVSLPRIPL